MQAKCDVNTVRACRKRGQAAGMLTVLMKERLRTSICSRFLRIFFSDLFKLVRAVVDSSVLKGKSRRIGEFCVCLCVCLRAQQHTEE
jgi:hypothetical protein